MLFLIGTAALGLAIGSFIGGASVRMGEGKPRGGHSRCPLCGHELAALDLIPLLSFVALRGRCRYCGKQISWWYPVIELGTAGLFILVGLHYLVPGFRIPIFQFPEAITFVRDLFGVAALAFLAVVDLRYGVVPDEVTLPAIAVVVVLDLLADPWYLVIMLLGALVGGGFFFAQYVLSRGKAVGAGDIRIGLLLGVLLGPWGTVTALLISYLVGALVAALLLAMKKTTMQSHIPLGPFLSLGGIIALLWGQQFIQLLITNY